MANNATTDQWEEQLKIWLATSPATGMATVVEFLMTELEAARKQIRTEWSYNNTLIDNMQRAFGLLNKCRAECKTVAAAERERCAQQLDAEADRLSGLFKSQLQVPLHAAVTITALQNSATMLRNTGSNSEENEDPDA